jgi:hypothetical protein
VPTELNNDPVSMVTPNSQATPGMEHTHAGSVGAGHAPVEPDVVYAPNRRAHWYDDGMCEVLAGNPVGAHAHDTQLVAPGVDHTPDRPAGAELTAAIRYVHVAPSEPVARVVHPAGAVTVGPFAMTTAATGSPAMGG